MPMIPGRFRIMCTGRAADCEPATTIGEFSAPQRSAADRRPIERATSTPLGGCLPRCVVSAWAWELGGLRAAGQALDGALIGCARSIRRSP